MHSGYGLSIIPITNSLDSTNSSVEQIKIPCVSSNNLLNCNPNRQRSKCLSCLQSSATINDIPKEVEKIQKQRNYSKLPHEIVEKSKMHLSKKILKDITKGLSFAEEVIEERSPHTLPYSRKKVELIYQQNHTGRKDKKKLSYSNKAPRWQQKAPGEQPNTDKIDHIDSYLSNDSFMLRVSSAGGLIPLLPQESFRSTNINIKSNLAVQKPSHDWDQHVLALLSKSTTNMILQDLTPHNQQEKINTFLQQRESLKNKPKQVNSSVDINAIEFGNEMIQPVSENVSLKYNFKTIKGKPLKHSKVVVQDSFPIAPSNWYPGAKTSKCIKKGMKRWTAYPKITENEDSMVQTASTDHPDRNTVVVSEKSKDLSKHKSLLSTVNEWRSQWLLEKKWENKNIFELQTAMKDINDHIRLEAVSASGKAILEQRLVEENNEDDELHLEETIVKEVTEMLNDVCSFVSLAAAVTLYSIDRANEKATKILLDAVKYGAATEKWVAVQCLAEYEYHDDCIIIELLSNINGNNVIKSRKAEKLLQHLSYFTISIQFMLAEQLNSTSWKDRATSCQILPLLKGTLTRDIANKLSHLMWNDWNKDVRLAAAQALGKSGQGKLVHDAFREKLKSHDKKEIIESLKKISSLGIVTDHLLIPILSCLNSQDDTICLQTIKTISAIKLCDEQINKKLVQLASSERNTKIKARIVRALGIVGDDSSYIHNCLLWSFHYERDVNIRVEACKSIGKLGYHDEETITMLQEMVIVEENKMIRNQIERILNSLGLETTGDMSMLESIRSNVKKLCGKDSVLAHMLIESEDDLKNYLRSKSESDKTDQSNHKRPDNVALHNSSRERGFNATLEAYRIRNDAVVSFDFPDIKPAIIPFWSESNESFSTPDTHQ